MRQSDLDSAAILMKVADSSGAKYSVHNEKPVRMTAPAPVVCEGHMLESLRADLLGRLIRVHPMCRLAHRTCLPYIKPNVKPLRL